MCGIAGVLTRDPARLEVIFDMTGAQAHRGPDGEGYLCVDGTDATFGRNADSFGRAPRGRVALGHRRLAILDVSDAGLQPMASHDGLAWIIHNGEIYNYLELRDELEGLGHRFVTGTDTEVVLAAYREWGTDCFRRFNGMWGMAIWDQARSRLVLARDRFGIKPLHLFRQSDRLIFASEIKALLASGFVKPRLNRAAAARFLRYSLVNHSDETMFDGIESFPAGHFAVVDPGDPADWAPRSYWELKPLRRPHETSLDEAAAEFQRLFTQAVRLRMRSDVLVGSCLSGGLDSSSVVFAATAGSPGQSMHTFTSAFEMPAHDERRWSDLVNARIRSSPHLVFPSARGFVSEHLDVMWHQEEPYPTTSIYAQWCLMKEARQQGVTVLLDGQGGDEALCGYRKYYFFYLQSLVRQLRVARALVEGVRLLRNGDENLLNWRQGARYLPEPLRSRVWSLEGTIRPDFKDEWNRTVPDLGLGDSIAGRQVADLTRFSIPALLRYEDRNSMAWSIEARVPFLDHQLIEFLVDLPAELKMKDGRTKEVMRHALRGLVPDEILDRRTKMGFNTPMREWLAGDLREFMEGRLARSDFAAASVLDPGMVADAYSDKVERNQLESLEVFFAVYAVDAWMERFAIEA